MSSVTITTGARLHFGPLSVGAAVDGRTFGGVGVMVDEPGFRIEITRQGCDEIDAGGRSRRVRKCLDACRDVISVPACRIRVMKAPPAHAGFGAGTQLALAVAAGLFRLSGETVPDAPQLAKIVGRGRRSAIGIHGFEHGGLIVDAGKSETEAIGALACRCPLPESWRFLLITPTDESGLCGQGERAAFDRLPPMPRATTDRLCRLVLTGMLPAARSADVAAFGVAMTEYGRLVGEFFAPEQGGVYAHRNAGAIIEQLRIAGVRGVVQTSWGPTLCALVDTADEAETIAGRFRATSAAKGQLTRIAAPLNQGADIRCDAR